MGAEQFDRRIIFIPSYLLRLSMISAFFTSAYLHRLILYATSNPVNADSSIKLVKPVIVQNLNLFLILKILMTLNNIIHWRG